MIKRAPKSLEEWLTIGAKWAIIFMQEDTIQRVMGLNPNAAIYSLKTSIKLYH